MEQVTFTCPRFVVYRSRLQTTLGLNLRPDNIVEVMLKSEKNCVAINQFIAVAVQALREENP